MKLPTPTSGRGWAYTGAVLGGLVSIAANVAHSFIAPTDAPANWLPEPGAVVSAIVWPVFLFIAVEILARVAWPAGRWWSALRFGGMTPVALVAAFVSYRHLSGLLHHYGEETIVAILGPLAVDGLMVMATSALLATSARAHRLATTAPVTVPAPVDVALLDALTARIADLETRPTKVPARKPATPARATSTDTATGTARPAADTTTKAPRTPRKRTNPKASTPTATPVDPTPAPVVETVTGELVDAPTGDGKPSVSDDLLPTARLYAESHRKATGEAIRPSQLAVRMGIPTTTADRLLRTIHNTDNTNSTVPALAGPHNGSRPLQDVTA
jgi:hypothetical protein